MRKKKADYKIGYVRKTKTLGSLSLDDRGKFVINLNLARMFDFQDNYFTYMHGVRDLSKIETSTIRRILSTIEHEHIHKILIDIKEDYNMTVKERDIVIHILTSLNHPYNSDTIKMCHNYTLKRIKKYGLST